MPAPGPPVAGSVAQTTGLTINPSFPATVNADDIIVIFAQAMSESGTIPTAFTWPSGFTEGDLTAVKNDAGTDIGCAGWAWKRADGTEDGASYSVTRNGTGGTSSAFMGQSCAFPGCTTSGTPWNVKTVNAPAAVSTGDFAPITTTVADSLILSAICKTGNSGNYGTPTDWTVVFSNSGTGGLDNGMDCDYRQVASTGTYDPASPTLSVDTNTGWAAFQIAFIPPGAGDIELTALGTSLSAGSASASVTRNLTASGTSLSGGSGSVESNRLLLAAGVTLAAGAALLGVTKLLTALGTSRSSGSSSLEVGSGGGVVSRLRRLLGFGA